MTGDIRWITSAVRYEEAVRLHRVFTATPLYVIAAAIDYCGGDVAKTRQHLLKTGEVAE